MSHLYPIGAAKIKLENKGDLSFFAKQDEVVSTVIYHQYTLLCFEIIICSIFPYY